MKLQDELINKQQQEHLTDGQMADKIGIHRVTYTNIKNGKHLMGPEVREKVIAAYPDLQGIFLSEITTQRKITK
jgi:DNA-binding XRE family transcriptional regulator